MLGLRLEDEAGVEERETERRSRMGMRGLEVPFEVEFKGWEVEEAGSESESGSSVADSPSSSSSSRPFGYASQEDCTWYIVIGVRFSRVAERVSKQ